MVITGSTSEDNSQLISELTVEQRIEAFNEKLQDKRINKKIRSYIEKMEELLGEKIRMELVLNDSVENEDYAGDNSEYYNSYSLLLRELLQERFDAEKREIFLTGEINEDTIDFLDTRVRVLNKVSNPEEPITLIVNSFGGCAYGMLAVIDMIESSDVQINTFGRGKMMSAGAIILICGKKRTMTKNSFLMIHDSQNFFRGSFKDMKNELKHLETLQQLMYNLLANHSKRDAQWWENTLQREVYLSAQEALDLGLIDEII